MNDPRMIRTFYRLITNDGRAIEVLEDALWGESRTCPYCGSSDTAPIAYPDTPYRCRSCRENFSVLTGRAYDHGWPPWRLALEMIFVSAKQRGLTDEQAVTELFTTFRWGAFPICPYCDSLEEVSVVSSGKPMPYRCPPCGKYFSVRTATIFEKGKVPLFKWLKVILSCGNGEKITSVELARAIGVSQKTAWRLQQVCSKAFTE